MYEQDILDIKNLQNRLGDHPELVLGRSYIWLQSGGSDQYKYTEITEAAKSIFGLASGERYFLYGEDRDAFLTLCLDLYAEAGKPPI